MKFYYIGPFPPPYGGVTIKNRMLFESINKFTDVKRLEYDSSLIGKCLLLIKILFSTRNFIIGVSNTGMKITKIIYYFKRNKVNNSIIFVMGGTFPNYVSNNKEIIKTLKAFKRIFVEADKMKEKLNDMGMYNINVIPNCRNKPQNNIELDSRNKYKEKSNINLKCLFFSKVSKQKGVDLVLESADKLKQNVSIDIYGEIDENYKNDFDYYVSKIPNVNYKGVLQASFDEVYELLSQYDLLLFPTRWKNEGVPGILIESKIAGITAIVSDINYNAEIINNGKDGIVLTNNNKEELSNQINYLDYNRSLLAKMKNEAKLSSEKYYIENYNSIIKELLQ